MKKLTTATVIGFLLIALIPTTRSEGEKVHQTALVHFFENRCRPLIRLPYSLTKKLLQNRSIKPGTALSIKLLFLAGQVYCICQTCNITLESKALLDSKSQCDIDILITKGPEFKAAQAWLFPYAPFALGTFGYVTYELVKSIAGDVRSMLTSSRDLRISKTKS